MKEIYKKFLIKVFAKFFGAFVLMIPVIFMYFIFTKIIREPLSPWLGFWAGWLTFGALDVGSKTGEEVINK